MTNMRKLFYLIMFLFPIIAFAQQSRVKSANLIPPGNVSETPGSQGVKSIIHAWPSALRMAGPMWLSRIG
jgi:hypothetical protein